MMNATEMTRAEVLAEIQRLAEIAVNMQSQENPEQELKEINREFLGHTRPIWGYGDYHDCTWMGCDAAEKKCRTSQQTMDFKNTLLNVIKSMGFKQTGNGVYSAKIGDYKGKIDFCMRIDFTTCSKPTAIVRDNGDYKYLDCATVNEAARLYKLSKRRMQLKRNMEYGDTITRRLRECISTIERNAE